MTPTDLLFDAVTHWAPARPGRCDLPSADSTELYGPQSIPSQHASRGGSGAQAVPPGYRIRLASSADGVLAAQHLRRAVFAEDGDAPASSEGRQTLMYGLSGGGPIEQYFDDRSDHLLVWHQPTDGRPQLVATARLLPPHANDASPRSAGLVADQYFGLRPLERLLNSTVEVSRLCVHPEHRGGAAVALLLGGIARYQNLTGYRYLLGQVPIDLGDGGHSAAAVWDLALSSNVAPAERRCRPRDPIAIGGLPRSPYPAVPPMLHACLRLGAKVCGPPGYNQLAHTADFLVLLDVHERDRGRLPGFD